MTEYNIRPEDRPFNPSITPAPEPEDELEDPEQPEQERKEGWGWVGAPDHPDAERRPDGISDLFEIDVEAEEADVDDLVDVDYDRDILDVGEDGTLDDLVDVSQEDIMGRAPVRRPRSQGRRRVDRYVPPTSMGGSR